MTRYRSRIACRWTTIHGSPCSFRARYWLDHGFGPGPTCGVHARWWLNVQGATLYPQVSDDPTADRATWDDWLQGYQ